MFRMRARVAVAAMVAALLLSSAAAFDMSTVESDDEGVVEVRCVVATLVLRRRAARCVATPT